MGDLHLQTEHRRRRAAWTRPLKQCEIAEHVWRRLKQHDSDPALACQATRQTDFWVESHNREHCDPTETLRVWSIPRQVQREIRHRHERESANHGVSGTSRKTVIATARPK